MKNLPMDLLRSYVTVLDAGGFTRAAQIIGRTQSAMSLQIKRLEEALGATLLDRSTHVLQPTEHGRRLYGYARRILALNDEVIGACSTTEVSGPVRFGAPNEFAASLLPEILGRFAQSHREVALDVKFDLSKNLLARMKKGEFDLVIALHDDTRDKSGTTLSKEPLVWVCSLDHDPHNRSPVPLVAAPEPCIYRNNMIAALRGMRKAWNIGYTSPSYSGIVAAVRAGLGVTVLAQSTVPSGVRILTARDKFPPLRSVEVRLHHAERHLSKAISRFSDYILGGIVDAPQTKRFPIGNEQGQRTRVYGSTN
jgi:DNA-binding transcriptional LysR family regulator